MRVIIRMFISCRPAGRPAGRPPWLALALALCSPARRQAYAVGHKVGYETAAESWGAGGNSREPFSSGLVFQRISFEKGSPLRGVSSRKHLSQTSRPTPPEAPAAPWPCKI